MATDPASPIDPSRLPPTSAAAAARILNYQAVKNEAYYRALDIDAEGHISVRPRLTKRHIEFLASIRTSVHLWDGTQGYYGISFVRPFTPANNNNNNSNTTSEAAAAISISISPRTNGIQLDEARKISTQLQVDIDFDNDEHQLQLQVPSNTTTAVNTELLMQQKSGSIPTDDESLAHEAKQLTEHREDRRKLRLFFRDFQRPAIICACVHALLTQGEDGIKYMRVSAYAAYRAASTEYMDALKAYSDVCEAVHVLHGVENSLERTLKENSSFTPLRQMAHAIEADTYVAAALRTNRAVELTTWALAMSELPDLVRNKNTKNISKGNKFKKKEAPKRLAKIYKDVGKCYDAVKSWKSQLKNIVLERKHADTEARNQLVQCWREMLDL